MSDVKTRPNRGLGKGLSALIAEINVETPENGATTTTPPMSELPLDRIEPGPFQPRKFFAEDALRELADSIKKNGVMQPIIVRPNGKTYQIVAGERRFRACRIAGITHIPAIVKELSEIQALEFALIENIQRQDLSPIEEAEGYQRIINECGYTQEQLALEVGKSRSHITNMLRLLTLPPMVKQLLDAGEITMGHARALVGVENAEAFAKEIVAQKLNVRQTENLIKHRNQPGHLHSPNYPTTPQGREDVAALEQTLSDALGLSVSIDMRHYGVAGSVRIEFRSLQQLDQIVQTLNRQA